jgi:hypothetical protein
MDDAQFPFNTRLVYTHLLNFKNGPPGQVFKKKLLYFELMIYDKYRGKNIGPQCVKTIGT